MGPRCFYVLDGHYLGPNGFEDPSFLLFELGGPARVILDKRAGV